MEYENIYLKDIYIDDSYEMAKVSKFLESQGIRLDKTLQYIVGLYQNLQMIAVGGISGNTLRSIAVDPLYKGTGVINKLISHLINKQYEMGNTHLFIYTKPENINSFVHFGFKKIAEVNSEVVLLENRSNGIDSFLKEISKGKRDGKVISSLVMNCNPFTLGHQYLIEKASRESDYVHVFLVWEERSLFPADVRYRLVKEGISHLKNVIIHKGRDYIISSATFPSYFIRDEGDAVKLHAMLDINIFGNYIAPALGINRRYVGEEPYCNVTKTYNQVMKELLPQSDIEVVEVPRAQVNDEIISASTVRSIIRESKLEEVRRLVPETTYNFLSSKEAEEIIEKIKTGNSRH